MISVSALKNTGRNAKDAGDGVDREAFFVSPSRAPTVLIVPPIIRVARGVRVGQSSTLLFQLRLGIEFRIFFLGARVVP